MKPIPLISSLNPGDSYTSPFRVILHESSRPGEWVTHLKNETNGEKFWGDYFPPDPPRNNYTDALADYIRRCDKYQVNPMSSWEQVYKFICAGLDKEPDREAMNSFITKDCANVPVPHA